MPPRDAQTETDLIVALWKTATMNVLRGLPQYRVGGQLLHVDHEAPTVRRYNGEPSLTPPRR
jgi:hypothetical protein